MPATPKKQASKVSTSKSAVAANAKFHAAIHPPWVDMIKECITVHSDTRAGVSRPTIKKFVESKYHININAAAASQLNRTIAHGSEKGIFVLPKGPSGKVKLASQTRPSAAKENTKPAVKKPVVPAATAKPAATKTPTTKKHAVKGKAAARPKAVPFAKKSVATSKKLPAASTTTKKAAVPRKTTYTTRKVASAKKPATTRKRGAKKAITGDKRPTPKVRGRTTSRPSSTTNAKAKPASKSKAKPASRAKPASKPKPASKVKPSSKASLTA